MSDAQKPSQPASPVQAVGQIREAFVRAFGSFLAAPTVMIAGFIFLAGVTYALDHAPAGWLGPLRSFMEEHVFGSPAATSALLGTVAGGIITIASITFSLLLLAITQSSASMTHAVIDQYLRRKANQLYFAYFIGTALYALITLATVDPPFNPVYGATVALLLAIAALYILLLLIYATITQMQPTVVISSIHDLTLLARQRQLSLIGKTRRTPKMAAVDGKPVRSTANGYLVRINVDAIGEAIRETGSAVEVECAVPIGAYVAYHDMLARIKALGEDDVEALAEAVQRAFTLDRSRDLGHDPGYGIAQLETIAWTTVSTSKQNPSPGLEVVRNLRDLLARWSEDTEDRGADDERLPVVYPDNVMERLFATFESLAVVSSESMQHQVWAEVAQSIAILYGRLPSAQRCRVDDLILRIIPTVGDHPLTTELEDALTALVQALEEAGSGEVATKVQAARDGLAKSIGELNSRSTRVPASG